MPLILVAWVAVFLAGCSERGPGNSSSFVHQSGKVSDTQQVMTSVAKGAPVIKTADQLFNTYMSLTGLTLSNMGGGSYATITNTFASLESQLPGSNDLGGYTAGSQVAINKLAALFCDRLVATALGNGSLAAPVFGSLSLSGLANAQLSSDAQRRNLASAVFARFWGSPSQEKLPPRESAVAELSTLLGEVYAAATPQQQGSAVLTQNLAKTACTAVLASLPVSLQ